MKKFITMILAIAMVITSVVVPMDKVKAAVGDYVWELYCSSPSDGSYSMAKRLIIGYDNNGRPIADSNAVAKAYYDANDNLIGLKENGVWTRCMEVDSDILPLDCYGRRWTIDDDGTKKEWDSNGNIIYQLNPGGKVVIDKRMKDITVDDGNEKDSQVLIEATGKVRHTFMVTEGFTSKKKLRCIGDGAVLNVKWSSSNPSIASVSEIGTVTGKKAGKTTLIATVVSSGQQVKVPVTVVKNKCYGTRDCRGTDVSGSISYDKKGNLVCKFKIKNTTKKKLKYGRKDNKLSFTISDGKHKNKSKSKRFGFTLKRGKSKTVTVTIKKSKLKAKYNLPESDIKACLFIDRQGRSILTHMGFTVDGK